VTLAVVETHPIQYHAPVYRALAERFAVPVTVVYGSDCSVVGYQDREFGTTVAWDTDLLSGYTSRFLSRVSEGGARTPDGVSARGLARALRAVSPSAVLLVGYSPGFHRAAFLAAWRVGLPVLFRGETTDHARRRGVVTTRARDLGLRWLYRRCARLLYVGRRSHEHFRRLGCPAERLVFSPYCVDTTPFRCGETARARLREAGRRALGIAPGEILVLFAGKLSPRKGPELLVRAIGEGSSIRGRLRLAFVGDGARREALRDLAGRLGVRASFVGLEGQAGLSRWYHAADLLALPSLHSETWGLVVNEALHHGLPCVVSDAVGSWPDLVEPGVTGEVFQAGSPDALAAALERALGLVGRPDVRAACRARVQGYTVDRAAEGIALAYRGVVESGVVPGLAHGVA
jgi:glycosyltransferase involved in cell wall biosynthesis